MQGGAAGSPTLLQQQPLLLSERRERETRQEKKNSTSTFEVPLRNSPHSTSSSSLVFLPPTPPSPFPNKNKKQCGKKCLGKNPGCCGGKCIDDLNGNGGPTQACGRCGQPCVTSNGNASCTAGTCKLSCNPRYSPCNATSLTGALNLNVPICVDTTVNPLFCGGCNSRCPFDRFGATTCGEFGNGVNATAASCKVTCSPSYPTQCGTIANGSEDDADDDATTPTSNCVNTNQDVNNCGGVRIFFPFL